MKLNKKAFFQIHSWIGIKLSILFFIVCFSGTLATLSHEMDWLFIPEIRANVDNFDVTHQQKIKNVRNAFPNGTITSWSATDESYLCDIVNVIIDDQRYYVFVNPYSGEVQGKVTLTFQRFFRDLHYYLFIPFQVGHFTVLFFGFMLFISLTTALLFYKKWWKKLFQLKSGNGTLLLYRSIHRLVGLWSIPFTILFSVTGIWYFLERTNVGNIGKISNPESPKLENIIQSNDSIPKTSILDFDKIVSQSQQAIPGLHVMTISPPQGKSSVVYVTGQSNVPLVRNRANRVYIDTSNYKVIKAQNAEDVPTIMYINDIADPLHFGYWGGLTTKIVWFFGGLGISILVLTGVGISLKREAKKLASVSKLGIWRFINWGIAAGMVGYMYHTLYFRYDVSVKIMSIVALGLGLFLFLNWYLFVYQINKRKSSIKKP